MHVVFTLANNSTAPYFLWFAQKAQNERNIRMSFVCLHSERPMLIDQVRRLGHEVYWIPFRYSRRKRGFLSAIVKLIILFRKIKPDVVHSHLFDDAVPGMIAARICGIRKRIITKGDAGFHWHYAPGAVWMDKLNNRLASHIVTLSGENKEFVIEKEKANIKKTRLIHHGIPADYITCSDPSSAEEFQSQYNLRNKKIIGSVARLIEWKGQINIVEAAKEVIKKHPDTVFVFVGNGPGKKIINDKIRDEGLESYFIFIEYISQEKMPFFYSLLNVFVHAATLEPFGFVIIEAMLNGIPVVSSKTGVARDAIQHLKNGWLAECGDSTQLAKGICYMLENNTEMIRNNAKIIAKNNFSFDKMWEKHLSLYRE